MSGISKIFVKTQFTQLYLFIVSLSLKEITDFFFNNKSKIVLNQTISKGYYQSLILESTYSEEIQSFMDLYQNIRISCKKNLFCLRTSVPYSFKQGIKTKITLLIWRSFSFIFYSI